MVELLFGSSRGVKLGLWAYANARSFAGRYDTHVTKLELFSKSPASATDDALVVAISQSDQPRVVPTATLSGNVVEALNENLAVLNASGEIDDVHRIPSPKQVSAKFVVFTGVGQLADTQVNDPESLRRAAGAAARSLTGVDTAVFALPSPNLESLQAVSEGVILGAHPTKKAELLTKPAHKPLGKAKIATELKAKDARLAIERSEVVAGAVTRARDLINLAPNELYPETFAEAAKAAVKGTKVKARILDDEDLRAGGYGGLLAVGQGSARGPRLVKLTYTPSRAKKHIALVGKGITFDTGGISIKPAAGMETMKSDMSGAAAVLHTVIAAAALEIPVRVTGYLTLAENMPSATAQRPSDVITIRGGKTVEVLNTDAEGRLVLADALVSAVEDEADVIIDIATLTGAQMVALGTQVSAVMGTEEVRDEVVACADECGEQMWPMPLPKELRTPMTSTVADIANIGERWGGMLSAGLFLQEFTDQRPWAHIDIAGPSFNSGSPRHYEPKGGTGVGVRTMLTLLENAGKE